MCIYNVNFNDMLVDSFKTKMNKINFVEFFF